jgi:hypothetical protein
MGFPLEWAVRAIENADASSTESSAIAWIIERMELEQNKMDDVDGCDSSSRYSIPAVLIALIIHCKTYLNRAGDEDDFEDGDDGGLEFLMTRHTAATSFGQVQAGYDRDSAGITG